MMIKEQDDDVEDCNSIEQKVDNNYNNTNQNNDKNDATTDTNNQKESNEEKENSDKEPLRDEEGLLLSYDVIICGTGLVQSILASALARANKSVLHIDGNDHYGEIDTVWTFDYLQERLSKSSKQDNNEDKDTDNDNINDETKTSTCNTNINNKNMSDPDDDQNNNILLAPQGSYQNLQFYSSETNTVFPVTEIGTIVETPYGEGKVVDKTNDKLTVELTKWTMADGSSPLVYFSVFKQKNIPADLEDFLEKQGVIATRTVTAQRILEKQSRSLSLDVFPRLLYASGIAVKGFLTSGVAEHLEFQTMQAVYWLQSTNAKLEKVPCSKGDVFQSSLLAPLDKRRFMKFFQLAMDYATERELAREEAAAIKQEEEEKVDSVTSTLSSDDTDEGVLSLNERQLNQGRSLARPQNKAISQKDLQTLYDCIEQNIDFDSYLSQHAGLSPQLRNLIRYALALETGESKRSNEVENGNSNLSALEGMGRLCDHLKALGRYGTTAFLAPLYGSGELSQFFCRSAAVYGATYLLRRIPTKVTLSDTLSGDGTKQVKSVSISTNEDEAVTDAPKGKHIGASHVILARDAMLNVPIQLRLLRHIGVLSGTLCTSAPRSVVIIPPGTFFNKYAVHGLILDESARVAPVGSTVLHLTTIIDEEDYQKSGEAEGFAILERAVHVILDSCQSMSEGTIDEIFHASFSCGLCSQNDDRNSDVKGMHVIGRSAMPMVVDEAFEQAKCIFEKICDKEKFLALSEEMQIKLKEQLQDAYRGNQGEDDTEQVVLDSAMEMLS